MGKLTLWEKLKEGVGGVAFKVFLWTISMTKDEYFDAIYKQEKGWQGKT